MPTEKQVRINLKLGETSHRRFKMLCIEHGWTLQDGLERAVTDFLKRGVGVAALQGLREVAPNVWRNQAAAAGFRTGMEPKAEVREEVPVVAAGGNPVRRVCEECFGTSDGDALKCEQCGAALRVYVDSGEDEEEDYDEVAELPADEMPSLAEDAPTLADIAAIEDVEVSPMERSFEGAPWDEFPAPAQRKEEPARAGPITAAEFEVPATWVDRGGVSRAENLRRYGEDDALEYWPPVKEPGLDPDAPVDFTAIKGVVA